MWYSGIGGNCGQIAIPYYEHSDQKLFIRYKYSGVWGEWTGIGGSKMYTRPFAEKIIIPKNTSNLTMIKTIIWFGQTE